MSTKDQGSAVPATTLGKGFEERRKRCYECANELHDRGGWYMCIGGEVYGPCESELCGGICEAAFACDCICHDGGK